MEAELSKKVSDIHSSSNKSIGVLLVDKLGLPVESHGTFDTKLSGILSSIMKNTLKLDKILQKSGENGQKSEDQEPNTEEGQEPKNAGR